MPRASGFFKQIPIPLLSLNGRPRHCLITGKIEAPFLCGTDKQQPDGPMTVRLLLCGGKRLLPRGRGFRMPQKKSGEAVSWLLRMDIRNFGSDLTPIFMPDLIDPLLILGVSEPVFGKTGQQMG